MNIFRGLGVIFLVCIYLQVKSQTIKIDLKDLSCNKGIIFLENYNPPFIIEGNMQTFTPSTDDILTAEDFLLKNRNDILYDENIIKFYPVKTLEKKLYKYVRQYVGYKTKDLDKIIIIHLLNFRNKNKAKKYFINWENEYIIGFGEFYEKNVITFKINLTRKTVSFF